MAFARGRSSAWGIAAPGEASYDVSPATAPTHLLYPFGAAVSTQEGSGFDMGDLATGLEESPGTVLTAKTTPIQFNGVADDLSLPILAAFALGTDVQSNLGDTSSAQHLITPVAIGAEVPSTAIQVSVLSATNNTANAAVLHTGCVVDTFSFGGGVNENKGAYSVTAGFRSSGTYATGASMATATRPTRIFCFNETYHAVATDPIAAAATLTGNLDLPDNANPIPALDEIGTQVDCSAALQAWRWNVTNELDLPGGHNTASTLVAQNMARNRRSQTLTVTYRWNTLPLPVKNARTWIGEDFAIMFAGVTSTVINGSEATPYRYGWTLVFPKATLVSSSIQPTGNLLQITANYQINDPNVSGLSSAHLYVWNNNRVSDSYTDLP